MTENLSTLKAAAEAATDGPWEQGLTGNEDSVFCGASPSKPVATRLVSICYRDNEKADANFIALSRTAVPALIEAVEMARKYSGTLYDIRSAIDEILEKK